MPLGAGVTMLVETNCVAAMLRAFQSNATVKALIFMPGATDEFYMFHRARRKLADLSLNEPENIVMIGDTMETDIRGAVEAGMQSFLVLSGSTQMEVLSDYVYQPTRILQSVADLTQEIKTGISSDRMNSPAFSNGNGHHSRSGNRHQTDIFAFHKPRPRPAMTK